MRILIRLAGTALLVACACLPHAVAAQDTLAKPRLAIDYGRTRRDIRDSGRETARWSGSARLIVEVPRTQRVTVLYGLSATAFDQDRVTSTTLVQVAAAARDRRVPSKPLTDWDPGSDIVFVAVEGFVGYRAYLFQRATGPYADARLGLTVLRSQKNTDTRPTPSIDVGYRLDIGREIALLAQADLDYLGFAAGLSDPGAARSPRAFFVPIAFGLALGL